MRSTQFANRSDCKEFSNNYMNKNLSRFSCWNIRTMSCREEKLVDKMQKYGLKVLGVSEAKVKEEWSEVYWRCYVCVFKCTRW